MSLADDFLKAASLAPPDKHWSRHFHLVARKITEAQRFEIATTARATMRELLLSKPSSMVEAAAFCRPPFPITWMEWAPPPDAVPVKPGQFPAVKVGALIESVTPTAFTFYTLWKLDKSCEEELHPNEAPAKWRGFAHAASRLGVSTLVAGVDVGSLGTPSTVFTRDRDWHQLPSATDDLESLAKYRDDKRNAIRWALKNPLELDALRKVEKSVSFRINSEGLGYETMALGMSKGKDQFNLLIRDLEDEIGGIYAVLILLNARNVCEITPVAHPPKLQKARVKQGKPALLDYSVVDIKLDRAAERAHASGDMSREAARLHVVRGHFKVRSSGVYWWRPFWRGSEAAGVVQRKGHVVT